MSDRTKPDKHPESKKIKIKPEFEEHYKKLLKENYNKFIDYSFSYLRRCIRINTLKIDLETAKKRLKNKLKLYPIPWCKEGFWVEDKNKERYDFGNMLEHQLGYFYLQEAASMIPAIVLDVKENMKVLDMCAAPGSKTSQIAQYMNNTGILIANDMSSMRLKALGSNLQKLGVLNSITRK
jgi:16S rRNA (cytosine1407-C5)-methyltransferase